MLVFDDPRRVPPRDLLHAPGAFIWWYLDLVDRQGDGVVVIWSFGLPFLPGVEAGSRDGHPVTPEGRPSINVVVYRGGRQVFYLLQEVDPADVSWTPDSEHVVMGGSTFSSRAQGLSRVVRLELDCPLPAGDRLVGSLRVDGAACHHALASGGDHQWTPLSVGAQAAGRLATRHESLWEGEAVAYHDRNTSRTPLGRLGIDRWIWGRTHDRVHYLLWPDHGEPPTAHGVEVSTDGGVTRVDLQVKCTGWRPGLYGRGWWRTLRLTGPDGPWAVVKHDRIVEDGPFYQRFQLTVDGVPGVGEAVFPHHIDGRLSGPLVQLCVHRPSAPSAWWTPWFTGPRRGRVKRVLDGLLGAAA